MYALATQTGNRFPAIALPRPDPGDLALLPEAIRRRGAQMRFSPTKLPRQTVSDLLWSACGVERRGGAGGVEASFSQAELIDIYVALEQGLYLYDPERLRLAPVLQGDLRPLVAAPELPRCGDRAPMRLVYVADVDRLEGTPFAAQNSPETQAAAAWIDGGVVAAHVYTYAAAAGLAAWAHDCDRVALSKRLPLRAGRRVLFGQTVGFPA
jgi:hypothetical protein